MTEAECLTNIVVPSQRRPNAYMKGIIQIHVTRSCDKCCFNCTQGSNLAGQKSFITLENFEAAVLSLKNYFGVVGLFGGNPALHPQFPTLCEILSTHIPFPQRGLWCNNPFEHAEVMRKTFDPAHSNLNVHLDKKAYDAFITGWPECNPVGLVEDSRHSPCYVAMQDIVKEACPKCSGGGLLPRSHYPKCPDHIKDEEFTCDLCVGSGTITNNEKIYSLIASCDINKNWSAMIAQFRGELRGYFCEIAGAQAILHQEEEDYPDHGIPIPYSLICADCGGSGLNCIYCSGSGKVTASWWGLPRFHFKQQMNFHCFACGVPLRGKGELACGSGKEQVSETHKQVYKLKRPKRELEFVSYLQQLNSSDKKVTEYLGR